MIDLLADLKEYLIQYQPTTAALLSYSKSAVVENSQNVFDVETQMGIKKVKDTDEPESEFMGDVMVRLDSIKQEISQMENVMERIQALKRQVVQATSPEQEKAISDSLNDLLAGSNKTLLQIKGKVEDLKSENERFAATQGSSAEVKMRENLQAVVTQKFREMLRDYQSLQTDFKKHVREKVTRQVRIVFPEASDQEINEIVDDGTMSAASVIQSQITGQTHESFRNALSDIQYKYKDIRKLEKNVEELHQMFVDLAVLVEVQSEMMDQIEYSVTSAKDYTEKAEKEIVQARKKQRKAKRRSMFLGTCCIVTLVMVAIPVIFVLKI